MAQLKDLIVNGPSRLIGDTYAGTVTADTIKKSGGTSSQFLKADGSVDSNTYALNSNLTKNAAGTGISVTGTNNATISINSTYQGYCTHGEAAYNMLSGVEALLAAI